MILNDILKELNTADKPIVKRLQEGKGFHVLAIGLKNKVVLKEHKTDVPAKLVVIKGQVIFKSGNVMVTLNTYDEHTINVKEMHSVEAIEDSLFLVIKG